MAGKTIVMSKLKQIIRLRNEGIPLQTIARTIGISRNTVKKYLRIIEVREMQAEHLLSLEDHELDAMLEDPAPQDEQRLVTLSSFFPYMEKELNRTGVTRWLLWGEYISQHPDGFSYSRFCDHFKQYKLSRSSTMVMEHLPGDKLFIDFAGEKLNWTDPVTGFTEEAQVFIAILGYSQLTYVQAVATQRKEDLIAATENALHFLGGVPRAVVPDNLKSAVQKADKYEAEINNTFLDFANHYGFTVLPARSYKPRDKAHVERAVQLVYNRIYAPLRNQVFHSLTGINAAIAEHLAIHNNALFKQLPYSRSIRFQQDEKQALQPLPVERYQMKTIKDVTVMKNGHVQIWEDKHYYSVPYRYIGCKVRIIYSTTQVAVYYNKERIAFHGRNIKKFGHTTVREHMPSTHQFVSEWNPDRFMTWAAAISPEVRDYIGQILQSATYPEHAYRSCVGILSYEKKVGRERLIKAVQRAAYYGAFNYSMIKRILQSGLDSLALGEESGTGNKLPEHDNIRGAGFYQ